MKINTVSKVVAMVAVAAGALLVASPALAKDDGLQGDAQVRVHVEDEDASSSAGVGVSRHGEGSQGENATTTDNEEGERGDAAEASSSRETHGEDVSEERNHGRRGSFESEEHASSTRDRDHMMGDMMSFDRDSDEGEASSSADISDPMHVKSDEDLRAFTMGIFHREEHVAHVEVSSSSVSTDFDSPAELFGLIPVSLPARVHVSGDGTVNVSYPWYAFLFATHKDAVTQGVSAAVQQTLSSSTSAESGAEVSLTARQQALLVDGIVSALQKFFGFGFAATTTAQQ